MSKFLAVGNQIFKKLPFINRYNVKVAPHLSNLAQRDARLRFGLFAIVSRNALLRVSVVHLKLYLEHFFVANLESLNPPDELSAFSSEHGTHYQLDFASLWQVLQSL